jgi:hypothetical protein
MSLKLDLHKTSSRMILKMLIRYKIIKKIKDLYYYLNFLLANPSFIQSYKNSKKIHDQIYRPSVAAIIFSKDRAMQLHSLLESFFDNKIGECRVAVIYSSSSKIHKEGYEVLLKKNEENILFINQDSFSSFQDCLRGVLNLFNEERIFFLVDDIIFIETIDYDSLSNIDLSETIFSLRMGSHLKYSYVIDSPQPLPKNMYCQNDFLFWNWDEGEMEWGYPLSLDGHIFLKTDIVNWCKFLRFKSPSSLEIQLQKLNYLYKKKQGMAYSKSRIVNIPINIVQNEVSNIHGSVHQDKLAAYWIDGMAIDVKKFKGMTNLSTHQEFELEFIKREAK